MMLWIRCGSPAGRRLLSHRLLLHGAQDGEVLQKILFHQYFISARFHFVNFISWDPGWEGLSENVISSIFYFGNFISWDPPRACQGLSLFYFIVTSQVQRRKTGQHPGPLSASCWTWRIHPCLWIPRLQWRIPGRV